MGFDDFNIRFITHDRRCHIHNLRHRFDAHTEIRREGQSEVLPGLQQQLLLGVAENR